jgi:hypothetical protein
MRPLPSPRQCLLLEVGDRVGPAASKRDNVISPIAGTGAGRQPGRETRMLALELARHRTRPLLARRSETRQRQHNDRDQRGEPGWTRGHWLTLPLAGHDV